MKTDHGGRGSETAFFKLWEWGARRQMGGAPPVAIPTAVPLEKSLGDLAVP